MPFLWSLPLVMVTAELGSAMPSNEGVFLWVRVALGRSAAFCIAIIYWLNYLIGTALYPIILDSYFKPLYVESLSPEFHSLVPFAITLLVLFINMAGVKTLAQTLSFSMGFQMIPIAIFLIYAFNQETFSLGNWFAFPEGELGWDTVSRVALCFQIILWNSSGYDAVGSIVENLRDPTNNLTKSLIFANLLGASVFFLAFTGPLAFEQDTDQWDTGFFQLVALRAGGAWFQYLVMASAIFSNLAAFNACLYATSQQLASLGRPDYLNIKELSWKHPIYQTPWVAFIVNALLISFLTKFPFYFLIKISNFFYAFIVVAICYCMINLRYSPDGKQLNRPMILIQSNFYVCLMMISPCLISIYLISSVFMDDWETLIVALGFFGCIMWLDHYIHQTPRQDHHQLNSLI